MEKYIKPGAILSNDETLADYIDQNGVRPRTVRKLEQFRKALRLRNTPMLYAQEGKGNEATVYVKIFDPCGSWTWLITEWDGTDTVFGLVKGHELEWGYTSLNELSAVAGATGIGLEIDVWFKPKTMTEARKSEGLTR